MEKVCSAFGASSSSSSSTLRDDRGRAVLPKNYTYVAYRIHVLFPSISSIFGDSCSIFPNCLAGLACSLPSGSRFILRSAHLFCFPLCFGFGGGLIVIIAVVIIVCCSFGLRLRFGFRCLGKLEKHRKQNQQQRCS